MLERTKMPKDIYLLELYFLLAVLFENHSNLTDIYLQKCNFYLTYLKLAENENNQQKKNNILCIIHCPLHAKVFTWKFYLLTLEPMVGTCSELP